MVGMFHSSRVRVSLVGQQVLLALFFCGFPHLVAATVGFDLGHDNVGGAGIVSTKHWGKEGLSSSSRDTWNYYAFSAIAEWSINDWTFFGGRVSQNYFTGNTNTLALVARNVLDSQIDLAILEDVRAYGALQSIDASKIGFKKRHQFDSGSSVELAPHLLQIHSYERTNADFRWLPSKTPDLLTGSFNQVGTRTYGFDPNDRPDSGWGLGIDAKITTKLPWGDLDVRANNLLSSLQFSNVHYSNLAYQVQSSGGKLIPSATPSISGRYGQFSTTEQLPIYWRSDLKPTTIENITVGLTGIGNQASPHADYRVSSSYGTFSIGTIGFRNTFLSWSLHKWQRFSVDVGIAFFNGWSPDVSNIRLRLMY